MLIPQQRSVVYASNPNMAVLQDLNEDDDKSKTFTSYIRQKRVQQSAPPSLKSAPPHMRGRDRLQDQFKCVFLQIIFGNGWIKKYVFALKLHRLIVMHKYIAFRPV